MIRPSWLSLTTGAVPPTTFGTMRSWDFCASWPEDTHVQHTHTLTACSTVGPLVIGEKKVNFVRTAQITSAWRDPCTFISIANPFWMCCGLTSLSCHSKGKLPIIHPCIPASVPHLLCLTKTIFSFFVCCDSCAERALSFQHMWYISISASHTRWDAIRHTSMHCDYVWSLRVGKCRGGEQTHRRPGWLRQLEGPLWDFSTLCWTHQSNAHPYFWMDALFPVTSILASSIICVPHCW